MKLFTKLYLSMLILLTMALAITEYFIVVYNMDSSINAQIETSLKQHQLVKYAIQSELLSAQKTSLTSAEDLIKDIAASTSDGMEVEIQIYNFEGTELYRSNKVECELVEIEEGHISYMTIVDEGKKHLETVSVLKQSGLEVKLITVTDINYIYDNVNDLQLKCIWIFIAVTAVGAIFALLFSNVITKPIKKLTDVGEAFSKGDYSGRVSVKGKDEISELSQVYNTMADTIEEKINDLELSVRQREDFTAAFAHELKTPMTSIIGYADTLYQKDLSVNEAREAAGFIVNEGMRLESLSFKLLELMTLNNHNFLLEEIEMRDFFKDIEDTIKPAALKRQVRMVFDYEPGYVKIELDLFKTLILNLIDNAMKSGSSDVAVLSQSKGNKYMIAIVDHGRGIPASELKRVTEAFYMVDKARSRKQHGAGLGLALCEKIAEIHGTKLDIRSKEGEGTAIRILLELVEDDEDED